MKSINKHPHFRWNIPLNYNGNVECYMVVCLLQVLIKAIGRNCLIRKQLYLHQNITTKRLWCNIQIPLYNNMKSGRDNIKTIKFSTSHCLKMLHGFSCCGCFLYTTSISKYHEFWRRSSNQKMGSLQKVSLSLFATKGKTLKFILYWFV